MFSSEERAAMGRYRVQIVSGEMRQKTHQQSVQATLDESSVMGWRGS